MLFNALSPLAAASADNKMLFCTSSGYQWVDVDSTAEPDAEQHCLKCIYSSDSELDTLSRQSVHAFSQTNTIIQPLSNTAFSGASIDIKLPRAPPINL